MCFLRLFSLFILVLQCYSKSANKYAFIVIGDSQYLAEKSNSPRKLDPYSEAANSRGIEILKSFSGSTIPEELGGGVVSSNILGVINTGDLIDSADKNGGPYPAMQEFEWRRYKKDFGLKGNDGKIPFPIYEVHGNHDGPQGDTFIVKDIINRNNHRPGIIHTSDNGLHYSWRWGPLHLINLGMFVGEGDSRRKDHHYAPRESMEFLIKDLREKVGHSGRPVVISFHLHPNCPEYDWPKEDLQNFWQVMKPYNVIALFHGHTHGSPPSRLIWDGKNFARLLDSGIDVFNPDDFGAAKTSRTNPTEGAGVRHGFLYVELVDQDGLSEDKLVVRSYSTLDNWKTHGWHSIWIRDVKLPD